MGNRDTDIRKPDVSVAIDNLNSMTISDFKKQARQKRKEANESRVTEVDSKEDDNSQDVLGINELMSAALLDESDDKDNDNV